MKVFTCTDHEGFWPVGVASLVVAEDQTKAAQLLMDALVKEGINQVDPFHLEEIDVTRPQAVILHNGDY